MKSDIEYYLEVVKEGETPKWSVPEEELDIGSQKLPSGFIQYWAYKKGEEDKLTLPPAEVLAKSYPAPSSVILIDYREGYLELILVKNGHAWAKTESSLDNLEENLNAILDFAKNRFNIKIEYFMTTEKVPAEIEKQLDSLENSEENEEGKLKIRALNTHAPQTFETKFSRSAKLGFSPLAFIIPVVILVLIFAGALYYKDSILSKIKTFNRGPKVNIVAEISPTATPIPTPSFDRTKYRVRILNGTSRTGAAATLGEKLKNLGWQISSVGNAKNKNTPQTIVRVKEGDAEIEKVLLSDLETDFKATSSSDLKEAEEVNAEVVIGKE